MDGAGAGFVAGVVESDGAQNDASAELYVVQLLPSRLVWKEEGCEVTLHSEIPGEVAADRPLIANLEVTTLAGAARACVLRLSVRMPAWAYAAEASLKEDNVITSVEPAPRPGTLLRCELREGKVWRGSHVLTTAPSPHRYIAPMRVARGEGSPCAPVGAYDAQASRRH